MASGGVSGRGENGGVIMEGASEGGIGGSCGSAAVWKPFIPLGAVAGLLSSDRLVGVVGVYELLISDALCL